MKDLTPFVICMDRAYSERKPKSIRKMLTELGGAWQQLYEIWKEGKQPYLLLVTDSDERRRQGAPLMLTPANNTALRSALQHCCADMVGQRCRWLILMRPGSAGREITETELELDFGAGVTA